MDTNYYQLIWKDFDESFILNCIEKAFRNLDYKVTNLHKIDRVHENGIDLLCENQNQKIALQAKVKPRKKDIKQFEFFKQKTHDMTSIYVYIENPTRHFSKYIKENSGNVEFWNANKLNKFLVENESIDYLCIFFSPHPIISSLFKSYDLIYKKKHTHRVKHKPTPEEIAKLWNAKDNVVKVWVSLYLIYSRWEKILMSRIERRKEEYECILTSIRSDLDLAYSLSGKKFVSSMEDLSEKHPDLIGLLWHLASKRSNWIVLTNYARIAESYDEYSNFTKYYWICPLNNDITKPFMQGFYSSMKYILRNFQEVTKCIEDAIDWLFAEIIDLDDFS